MEPAAPPWRNGRFQCSRTKFVSIGLVSSLLAGYVFGFDAACLAFKLQAGMPLPLGPLIARLLFEPVANASHVQRGFDWATAR
jgi:hypothetical protein